MVRGPPRACYGPRIAHLEHTGHGIPSNRAGPALRAWPAFFRAASPHGEMVRACVRGLRGLRAWPA